MGLFDFVRSQLIEVIEATDFSANMMVFRFPVQDHEIKMGAQLTVREGQFAVFMNEGIIADVFGPGRYTLTTENMPVLTKLKSWQYGFKSPFKAEVYFVSSRLFINQKWGTQKPVIMRDKEFGIIRLSAYGMYSYQVTRPEIFLRKIFGTLPSYTTQDIQDYLRRMVVSGLSDLIGETQVPIIDIVRNYDELAARGREKMQSAFEAIGLTLQNLVIENISLPQEVEKVIDKRTSMGVLGDLGTYTHFQTAEAIPDFARNNGAGIAGMGVGLGVGAQMGQVVAASMPQNVQPAAAPQKTCPHCSKSMPVAAKFCPFCGESAEDKKDVAVCPACEAEVDKDARFCPNCGAAMKVTCPKCGAEMTGKFCAQCGTPRP